MKILASSFLEKLAKLDSQKLENIKGIGQITIENLQKFIESEAYNQIINKLQKLESENKGLLVEFSSSLFLSKTSKEGKKLENGNFLQPKIICITGTFEIPRNEIIKKLEQKGYKIANSLTKEVQILLAGEKAGSKLEKAQKINIKIVENWQELE